MGANVAGIFASFGNAKVYCVGRDIEKIKKVIPRIVQSVRADAIDQNLIPADYSMLERCIRESDLVFESLAEDIGIKTDIAHKIAAALPQHAISCSGTSGLSITTIAECYPPELRGHFFGIHMYNPPYNMPLCELTATCYSDKTIEKEISDYLTTKLFRTVVKVKDSPAFLGNRIGFQFINNALVFAEKYKDNGGIDYIDAILGPFTGRAMAPIMTSDFVGLDVHKAIVDNLYANTKDYSHESFILPCYVQNLIDEKKLGRKSGEGLYKLTKYENGLKRQTVFDINSKTYRDVIPYVFPFAEKMKDLFSEGDYKQAFACLIHNHSQEATICRFFLLDYIVYSLYAAHEVGYSIEAADDVMATGFNWCPPLGMYQALSLVSDVPSLIRENIPNISKAINIDELLSDVKPSKYDFRSFFKSGRKF